MPWEELCKIVTDGWNCLHAAGCGRNGETAELLLSKAEKKGCLRHLVTAKTKHGATPLHVAARAGDATLLRNLINCGADVTAQDGTGQSPHDIADANCRTEAEVLALLPENGKRRGSEGSIRNNPMRKRNKHNQQLHWRYSQAPQYSSKSRFDLRRMAESREETQPLRQGSNAEISSISSSPWVLPRRPRALALALSLTSAIAAIAVAITAIAVSSASTPCSPSTSLSSPASLSPARFTAQGHAVVATDHPRCSSEALIELEEGGNAADAVIRAALCLGVQRPVSSGLGGGFFLLHVNGSNASNAEFLDARETSPARVSNSTFEHLKARKSVEGGLSVATPAEGPGLIRAFQLYSSGNRSWEGLVRPAADSARNGVEVDHYTSSALSMSGTRQKMCNSDGTSAFNGSIGCSVFFRNGGSNPLSVGDTLKQPKLAETLDSFASNMTYLQSPEFAEQLALDVQRSGGNLSADDIMSYEPKIREPLRTPIDGVELIGPGPPSSSSLVQHALGILGMLPSAADGGLAEHHRVEALKSAFAYRLSLGDPDFQEEAQSIAERMVQDSELKQAAENLSDASTQPLEVYTSAANTEGFAPPPDDDGTTHVTVVDKHGNIAALTSTVNTHFGSGIVSQSTGLTLNNEMDDFSIGSHSNVYGLPFTEANAVEPGKRPLSSMSPMAVMREGKLRAAVGASGGPRIITGVTLALERHLWRGQQPLQSVAPARVHHQLIPDTVQAENMAGLRNDHVFTLSESAIEGLRAREHVVNQTSRDALAAVQMVVSQSPSMSEPSILEGVSDPRKLGKPAAID